MSKKDWFNDWVEANRRALAAEAENVRLRAERETLAGLAAAWLKGWECDAYDDLPERTRAALSPRRITREKSDAFLRWFEENVEPAFPRQPTDEAPDLYERSGGMPHP